jgi:hypothetical protein
MSDLMPDNDSRRLPISHNISTFVPEEQPVPFQQAFKIVWEMYFHKILAAIFASYLNKTYFCAVWILSK